MSAADAPHGTESRYRWEVKHGGSCEACRKAHGARSAKEKVDAEAWTGGWVQKGMVRIPVGPRPVDPPQHFCLPALNNTKQPIKHGTDTGYGLHKRRKEEACEPCKAAHRQAWHDRRRAAKRNQIMTRQERLAKGVAA